MNELAPELKSMVVEYVDAARTFWSLSLTSTAWARIASQPYVQERMKSRFVTMARNRYRHTQWDIEELVPLLPDRRTRHGIERRSVVPHRVGGSGADVFYAEIPWRDGLRDGELLVWEINACSYGLRTPTYREHPYEGMAAIESWEAQPTHQREMEQAAAEFAEVVARRKAAYSGLDGYSWPWERWGALMGRLRWEKGRLISSTMTTETRAYLESYGILDAMGISLE